MPPVIFNVGLFLDKRYMGDVIGLFCVSVCWYVRWVCCDFVGESSFDLFVFFFVLFSFYYRSSPTSPFFSYFFL